MTLSYKLRYNRDAGEYLNEVHFKELLQWITTETMLAVLSTLNPSDHKSMSLKYEPTSVPQHSSVKWLFLKRS